MKTGIIKYRKYEENVLLDQFFIIDELIKIVTEDHEFERFSIHNREGKMLLSTSYEDTSNGATFLQIVPTRVKKDVEILGTTYDAYKEQPFSHRTKTTWKVGSYRFTTRKQANLFINFVNSKARTLLENMITM